MLYANDYTCQTCGRKNTHPTDDIRCYRVDGRILCNDCVSDAYAHGDNEVSFYGDVVIVTPNDGGEAFALLPTDATDTDRDDLLCRGVPAAN